MGNVGSHLLVRRPSLATGRVWSTAARDLIDASATPEDPYWLVGGGPGTGKTALIVDTVAQRIAVDGYHPESVLVLVPDRAAAGRVREAISAVMPRTAGWAGRGPLVRTLHSYAFAILRLQAALHGNPPPRLLTGSEQDAVIREMLRAEVSDGADDWPDELRPALGLAGFARELRDLMLRAAERGFGPEDLVALGRRHDRPRWVAAGRFANRYEQVMLLRGSVGVEAPEATAPGLDAAELIGSALAAFATDPELLARERARVRVLLVDDAQHLDPQAVILVRALAAGTDQTVIAADPDQSVFGFRGADPRWLGELPLSGGDRRVGLDTSTRSGSDIVRVVSSIAARLPGSPAHRPPLYPGREAAGRVDVEVATSTAEEAAIVANTLRRAHLEDGVAWTDMAVIVRSVPRSYAAIRRALVLAGVPVAGAGAELPLHRQFGAGALLLALRAATTAAAEGRGFDIDDATALISGPIGGADPISWRRLRRGVRRVQAASEQEPGAADASLRIIHRFVLDGGDGAEHRHRLAGLTEIEAAPMVRAAAAVGAARVALDRGDGLEQALWAVWQTSGLQRRWVGAAKGRGAAAAAADQDLDSVVALFEAAGAYVDRLPGATTAGFVEYVVEQELPMRSSTPAAERDAVEVISAHAAAGREWSVVAVCGVQENLWPNLRPRGSILGIDELFDLTGPNAAASGGTTVLSRTAPLVAEERRLFLMACGRARDTLLITAVQSAGGDTDAVVSRFVNELPIAPTDPGDRGLVTSPAPGPGRRGRLLAAGALIAELRAAVGNPDVPAERRERAARSLARLAEAGVAGAHPDEWYGVAEASTDTALWQEADGPVRLSPSTVETLLACPLRWLLERNGGSEVAATPAAIGSLVHDLAERVADGAEPAEIRAELDRKWEAIEHDSPWLAERERERVAAMVETFRTWLRATRTELTEVGHEMSVDGVLPATERSPAVRLTGRIDRLERDALGRPVVVDLKTSKNPITKDDAAAHAQLATYQLAVAEGLVPTVPAEQPGGGRLVYLAKSATKTGATEREQNGLGVEELAGWRELVGEAALATRGPLFRATVNATCRTCPVATSCPAHEHGRQVVE